MYNKNIFLMVDRKVKSKISAANQCYKEKDYSNEINENNRLLFFESFVYFYSCLYKNLQMMIILSYNIRRSRVAE